KSESPVHPSPETHHPTQQPPPHAVESPLPAAPIYVNHSPNPESPSVNPSHPKPSNKHPRGTEGQAPCPSYLILHSLYIYLKYYINSMSIIWEFSTNLKGKNGLFFGMGLGKLCVEGKG